MIHKMPIVCSGGNVGPTSNTLYNNGDGANNWVAWSDYLTSSGEIGTMTKEANDLYFGDVDNKRSRGGFITSMFVDLKGFNLLSISGEFSFYTRSQLSDADQCAVVVVLFEDSAPSTPIEIYRDKFIKTESGLPSIGIGTYNGRYKIGMICGTGSAGWSDDKQWAKVTNVTVSK